MENSTKPSNETLSKTATNELIPEQEELSSKEYLGTFRWKRSWKFPLLPQIQKPILYSSLNKWADYINIRLTQKEFEPYVIDALSYPLSIIYSLNQLIANETISTSDLESEPLINNIYKLYK